MCRARHLFSLEYILHIYQSNISLFIQFVAISDLVFPLYIWRILTHSKEVFVLLSILTWYFGFCHTSPSRNIASLYRFYKYFDDNCSNELSSLVHQTRDFKRNNRLQLSLVIILME